MDPLFFGGGDEDELRLVVRRLPIAETRGRPQQGIHPRLTDSPITTKGTSTFSSCWRFEDTAAHEYFGRGTEDEDVEADDTAVGTFSVE